MIRAVILASVLASPALAQQPPQCGPRADMAAMLLVRYQETPIFLGVMGAQGVAESWVNPNSGSWTMTISGTDGVMCIVFSGTGFDALPVPPAGEAG